MDAAAYARQLKQLLPRGVLWKLEPDSWLSKLLLAIGDELARIDGRAGDLLREWDPRTAVETLPDWERMLGIPDDETAVAATVTERQFNITRKYVARGGATPAYFIQVAALLGYSVTIDEPGTAIPEPATLVAAGTVSENGQPGLPTGYAANDMLVALVAGNPAAPSGWTRNATATRLSVYTRRSTASESVPNFGAGLRVRMAAFRKVYATGDAVEAVGSVGTDSGGLGSVRGSAAPSVTTLSKRALVLLAHGDYVADAYSGARVSYGDPAAGQPATGEAFANAAGPAATARGIGLWFGTQENAGASGAANGEMALLSAEDGTYESAAVMLALKPSTTTIAAHTWRMNVHPPYAAATGWAHAGSSVGDRLFVRGDSAFEAVINRWKPAHTVVVFNYL